MSFEFGSVGKGRVHDLLAVGAGGKRGVETEPEPAFEEGRQETSLHQFRAFEAQAGCGLADSDATQGILFLFHMNIGDEPWRVPQGVNVLIAASWKLLGQHEKVLGSTVQAGSGACLPPGHRRRT